MTGAGGAAFDPRLVRRLTAGRVHPGVIEHRVVRATAERRVAARDRLPILARLMRRAAPPAGGAPALPRVRAVPVAARPAGESRTTTRPTVVVGARRVRGDDRPIESNVRPVRRSILRVLPQAAGAEGPGAASGRAGRPRPVTGVAAGGTAEMALPAGTVLPTGAAVTAPPDTAPTALPVIRARTRSAAVRRSRSPDGPGRVPAARPRPAAGSEQGAASAPGDALNRDGATGRSTGSSVSALPIVRARRPAGVPVVRGTPGAPGVRVDYSRRGGTRGDDAPTITSGAQPRPDTASRATGIGSGRALPLAPAGRTGAALRLTGHPRSVPSAAEGRSLSPAGGVAAAAGEPPAAPRTSSTPRGVQPVQALGAVVQAKRGAPSRAAEPAGLDPATADELVNRVLKRLRQDITVQAERRGVGR